MKTDVLKQLKLWRACSEGYDWSKAAKVKSLSDLWNRLPRQDWMLWVLRKHGVSEEHRKPLVLWALECARDVLPIWEKRHPKDKSVSACLEATADYMDGKISLEALRKKRKAAYAAAAYAYAATAAAAYAAAAYYAAAYYADAADAAAYDAADAADAAAYYAAAYADAADAADAYADAADADAADAKGKKRLQYADALRKALPNPFN